MAKIDKKNIDVKFINCILCNAGGRRRNTSTIKTEGCIRFQSTLQFSMDQ